MSFIDDIESLIDNIPMNKVIQLITQNCNTNYYNNISAFHEHIYMSENVSIYDKMIIMFENDYDDMIYRLNDDLSICNQSKYDRNTKDKLTKFIQRNKSNKKLMDLFDRFINLHSHFYDFDVFQLKDNVINESTYNIYTLYDCSRNTQNIQRILTHIQHINFNEIFENLNSRDFIDRSTSRYCMNMIIELDNKCDILLQMHRKNREKLLTLWLRENKNNKNNLCNGNFTIITNYVIKNILSNMALSFSDMNYIFATDDLDTFKCVTKNLNFKTIHPSFMSYLSPNILKYIFELHEENNHGDFISHFDTIIINLHNLDMFSVHKILPILYNKKCINNIELMSIAEDYNYIKSLYIMMYTDYMILLSKSKYLFHNLSSIFHMFIMRNVKNSFRNYYLDVIILQTVLDNVDFTNDNVMSAKILLNSMSEYMQKDENLFISGPDFQEIYDELHKYQIQNLTFIEKLISEDVNQ